MAVVSPLLWAGVHREEEWRLETFGRCLLALAILVFEFEAEEGRRDYQLLERNDNEYFNCGSYGPARIRTDRCTIAFLLAREHFPC